MAEAFGIVAGVMGIAGLFNNSVDCFEYIHLARTFDCDFRTAQLKLDFAKLRLTRWGEAADINGGGLASRFASAHAQDLAEKTLWQVLELFAESARVSDKFGVVQQQQPQLRQGSSTPASSSSSSSRMAVYDPDTDSTIADFHGRLLELTGQRRRPVGVVAKAKWALHRGKYLDKLIGEITLLIGQLEKLLPGAGITAAGRLGDVVFEEVTTLPMPDLQCIEEHAAGTDELLREAARDEICRRESEGKGHIVGDVEMSDDARVRVGDEVAEAAVKGYKPIRMAGVTVGNVKAPHRTRFHAGHSIGGRSVMD